MKRILFALSLVGLLTLTACGGNPPAPTSTPAPETPVPTAPVPPVPSPEETPEPVPVPTATPEPEISIDDYRWGTLDLEQQFTAEDGTAVLTLDLTLPQVLNPEECPAGETINAWYAAEKDSRVQEAEQYAEDLKADYELSQGTGLPFDPVTQEMSFVLTRMDDTVISVSREWYVNFGGPHPNTYRLSEQFDPKTGTQLGFADFFTEPDAVVGAAVERLAKEKGFADSQITAVFQPEDFYFTDEGCVFWIQGGQFPGINAPLEITIPYSDLEAWMNHG